MLKNFEEVNIVKLTVVIILVVVLVVVLSSPRAKRAGPRALELLLADGAPTVGWGKTFWRVGRVPLTKTGVTRKRKIAQ